jgi:hypothetical protein
MYVKAITNAHEMALRVAREQAGEETWVSINFPEVILILPGLIIHGRVVSYLEYLKRMRDVIASAPGDRNAKEIIQVFSWNQPLLQMTTTTLNLNEYISSMWLLF